MSFFWEKIAFRPLTLGILSKSDAKFNISCQNYAIHKGVSYDADIENKDCTTFLYLPSSSCLVSKLSYLL